MLHRAVLRSRQQRCQSDIIESRQLLWELLSHASTVQHCLTIIESTCLACGVNCFIDGERCGYDFQEFVNRHYGAFCRKALRSFFGYGFVPWILRKDANGNDIPDVMPDGTFHWDTELGQKGDGQSLRNPVVQYKIQLVHSVNVKPENVYIYEYSPPALGVSTGSFLHSTVSSPMSQLLVEYKELRQAQIRRTYADAWNTTAKLICKYTPKTHIQDDPSSALMDFADERLYEMSASLGLPLMPALSASNLDSRNTQIKKQFEDVNTHVPDIFTLPKDHDIVSQVVLHGRDDIPFLWDKFQRGVSSVMHVPFEMINSRAAGSSSGETTRKTVSSGKVFSNTMAQICTHLELLCKDVYFAAYGNKAQVRFKLTPQRRMELESIEDLKILFEIGALTASDTLDVKSLLADVLSVPRVK